MGGEPDGVVRSRVGRWWLRSWRWLAMFGGGVVIGMLVRGFLPPFVLDDPFWRDFWTGPPAGGVFALAGAVVAFVAAWIGARFTRRAAVRQEWWDRAEWALSLAISERSTERDAGLAALEALVPDATEAELGMMTAVTRVVLLSGGQVANGGQPGDDGAKRKWRLPWQHQRSGDRAS